MSTTRRIGSKLFKKPAAKPAAQPKPAPTASMKKKAANPKRRVLFVEASNTVHEYEAVDRFDQDLLESLWQQGWEMGECKEIIKLRAKQWRRTGMGVFLNNAYLCDNDLDPALCQKQLNTLVQLPDEMHMRGVERYLSRKHDQDRTTRKRAIVHKVVAQFYTLKDQVSNGILTQPEAEHFLGIFARGLNKDAEHFARRMGKADESVMRNGTAKNMKPALELMEYLHALELERARKGTSGQLKTVPTTQPPASAAKAIAGRRLQARQA